MSMTNEALRRHLQDPAIFCCRRQKGLVISAADLEDPSLFEDMEEAGLLTLSPEGLRVEQVLGCTLMQDVEALTPITREVLDRVNEPEGQADAAPAPAASAEAFAPVIRTSVGGNGMIHIEIGKAEKLENLVMDSPLFGGPAPAAPAPTPAPEAAPEAAPAGEKKVIRTLVKKHIRITGAEIGDETSIRDGKITIDRRIVERAV